MAKAKVNLPGMKGFDPGRKAVSSPAPAMVEQRDLDVGARALSRRRRRRLPDVRKQTACTDGSKIRREKSQDSAGVEST